MIRIVGIDSDEFEKGNITQIYEYFEGKEEISVDSETEGFDCHSDGLLCIQMGDYDNQWVVHPDYLPHLKDLLEGKILLMQNGKFDLKFLYKNDIWPRKVYDTFLTESVLTCGLKMVKRDLASLAKRRLDVDLDKSVRENIWEKGLTKEVIEYSADDVKYLGEIKKQQMREIVKAGMEKALDIENQFVLCLAYIEYSGIKLNEKGWKKKCKEDIIKRDEALEELNKYIIDNNIVEWIGEQLDLFSAGKEVTLNWRSPKQVIELFESLGIPVNIIVKGKPKKSVESKHIEKHAIKFPIVGHYLKYRELEKVVTTYGQNFIDQQSPVTGRIHTSFRQIMDTSRTSSGGKNKNTKEEYINFQNIPKDKTTRECFIAEEGNSLIVSDYSGQEQVILANKCLDKNLLEFYDNGYGDMHSYIAQKMYPELQYMDLEKIKEKHDDKRQNAKIAGFTIAFGGNEMTISGNQNIPMVQAKNILDSYFGAFPKMKEYFEQAKQQGLQSGNILISEHTGRRWYAEGFDTYTKLKKEINREFWDKWKWEKVNPTEDYEIMKEKISTFYKIKGAIERKSLNFPVQGTAAEISKLGGYYFFLYILDNRLQNKVLIPNFVHDEYVVECPDNMSLTIKNRLVECMERSGKIYCKRVKLKAAANIGKKWIK